MSYEVKIDAFQGPIDLLWHLLQKDELEIYDIKIAEITEQYLDYIATMQRLDLDVASEFLIMAARLMEIKAQTLLPSKDEDDNQDNEDPRQKLVERLLEYKKYKDLATELREFEQEQRKSYTRNVAPLLSELEFEEESPLEDIKLDEFVAAFEQVLTKKKQRKEEENEEQDNNISHLEPEEITIKEQKGYIMQQVVKLDGEATLWEIFSKLESKLEIIVTFMALLELIKIEEVKVEQESNFTEVMIYHVERDTA
ncbi:segregation and condensation protein A [Halanaerobacter jeridensis]|uniref:Segregation and condensation protein A n=1 Tax=Halanaerobacter jeridensis TaxID=706427 RepID=A0A938XQ99_9FIRM|nr:segregation/condensation protein A [Halanaerobacter jeridensis]MBM7555303.1 segregation and condensation protein A [Halanaerobacter jeridensis]